MQSSTPIINDLTYEILHELGEGGVGVVYKAWHKRLQKHVVLKLLKDGVFTTRHQRVEVDILKNLKHSHLPQLYDFISDDDGVYTVMEFIPGQSFADVLKGGQKFSQQEVIVWARQLSSALSYLHNQKPPVLHSDIKPANIMLTPDMDVCLIDFNISLVLDEENAEVLGVSHGYASPEQYGPTELPSAQQIAPASVLHIQSQDTEPIDNNLGNATTEPIDIDLTQPLKTTSVIKDEELANKPQESISRKRKQKIFMDARSDIYSLGATLYHLLTGIKPSIATGNVKPLSQFGLPFSEGIIYIIEKCMERDPAKRFQTAGQLHDALISIHKLDSRWKWQNTRKNIAACALTSMFVLSGISTMLGWQHMGIERDIHYNELVMSISTIQDKDIYLQAVALFPDRLDARHTWAITLFEEEQYQDSITYINNLMASLSAKAWSVADMQKIGDILFVQGNSFFELEDYHNAVISLETAVQNNPNNPEIYRDLAIALVRTGNIDDAALLLSQLLDTNIGSDSISLLRGEIAYALGQYSEAVAYFKYVISATNDMRILQRAYMFGDRAYQRLPYATHERVSFLRDAVIDLPVSLQTIAIERLADALVQAGRTYNYGTYLKEAITLYQQLQQRGIQTFAIYQNIGLLYQEVGNFAQARYVYTAMLDVFSYSYQVPMRLAFLTLEEQAALPNEDRDYNETRQWYMQAQELYNNRVQNIEMMLLSSLINELYQNNWLN